MIYDSIDDMSFRSTVMIDNGIDDITFESFPMIDNVDTMGSFDDLEDDYRRIGPWMFKVIVKLTCISTTCLFT